MALQNDCFGPQPDDSRSLVPYKGGNNSDQKSSLTKLFQVLKGAREVRASFPPLSPIISPQFARRGLSGIQQPALLCMDTSGSMAAKPIDELNKGLPIFIEQLLNDPRCRTSIVMAIATFGTYEPFELAVPFSKVEDITPPKLMADGGTPFCAHLVEAVNHMVKTTESIGHCDLDVRPGCIFAYTDGQPDLEDMRLVERLNYALQVLARKHKINVFLFGVGPQADMRFLRSIEQPERPAERLNLDRNFASYFRFLYDSLSMASQNTSGSVIEIRSPNGNLMKLDT